ncbi:MAG: efflux RND transporter periplasmic adaptor subunit [Thermoleophilia bacterium]|nr:efflux RND transporter periplasmic adaptor subunit [Thermoleophilia bacterium]
MSIASAERGKWAWKSAWPWLSWAVLGAGVALLIANLALHETLFHRGAGDAAASAAGETAPAGPDGASATTVALTEEKRKAAGLETEPSTLATVPMELGVPGTIEANLDRQVLVRPRAPGVVREAKALLGQVVKKGDLLAILDSPDVGTARLDLRARQRALGTARIEARFRSEVARNVADLIPLLRRNTEVPEVERTYSGKTLGAARASLLGAYAKYATALQEEEKTTALFKRQVIGEHPMVVATHAREGAQAEFQAAVEQARFDANQEDLLAAQRVKKAEADVVDAAQRLRILGVPEDISALLAESAPETPADEDVTAYRVVAPFDGTLIAKAAVPSQRVTPDDALYTLADLSAVWVRANVRESDFPMLPALKAGTIRLSAAGYPGRSFEAHVLSISPTVDPATRTVALRAETPNADGLLKLGMFVRITVDTADASKVVTVPTAAIVEIEGKHGVFVPSGDDGRTFSFKPLTLGRETAGRQVVADGLGVGEPVVSKGAFLLKSELILQNETDGE